MSRLQVLLNYYKIGNWHKQILLQHLEITLEQGKILGLLGRNGCGKSSFMQVIFGKRKADCTAHYNGNIIDLKNHLHHQLVAYLHQDPFMITAATVTEAVQMWYPDPVDQDRILYEPLIQKVHLTKVGSLSIGERRFLEFLLVIHTERPFILLDEPFSMLAPLQIERVKEIILEKKKTKGILISDHYYTHVMDIAEYSLLLNDSKFTRVTNEEDLRKLKYL